MVVTRILVVVHNFEFRDVGLEEYFQLKTSLSLSWRGSIKENLPSPSSNSAIWFHHLDYGWLGVSVSPFCSPNGNDVLCAQSVSGDCPSIPSPCQIVHDILSMFLIDYLKMVRICDPVIYFQPAIALLRLEWESPSPYPQHEVLQLLWTFSPWSPRCLSVLWLNEHHGHHKDS